MQAAMGPVTVSLSIWAAFNAPQCIKYQILCTGYLSNLCMLKH